MSFNLTEKAKRAIVALIVVKNRDGLPQKIVLLEIGDFQIWRQALQGEAGVIGLLARDDSFPIAPSRESRL